MTSSCAKIGGVVALLPLMLLAAPLTASQAEQSVADYIKEQTLRKEFVITKSTQDYEEARRAATEAARRLRVPLRLRDLAPDGNGKLTFPEKVCEENGWDAPCYVARGRSDDGFYISIEHSSGYPEFRQNLFIVVVASGPKGSAITKRAERVAKSVFPDAYARIAAVYMGCIH
jgi:hypothetical protein